MNLLSELHDCTQQLCPLCNHAELSDELHYLFNCSALSQHRVLYLKKYYFVRPNTLKMHQLFNCNSKKQMYNLAKFVSIIMSQFLLFAL
jgi:hypothetical protein